MDAGKRLLMRLGPRGRRWSAGALCVITAGMLFLLAYAIAPSPLIEHADEPSEGTLHAPESNKKPARQLALMAAAFGGLFAIAGIVLFTSPKTKGKKAKRRQRPSRHPRPPMWDDPLD